MPIAQWRGPGSGKRYSTNGVGPMTDHHAHDTSLYYPMDPSTFLGSVWGIIYYNLEG